MTGATHMAITGAAEIVVFVLAGMQAVGVGIIFALAPGSRHRSALHIAGALFVGAAVLAGVALGATAPWFGPIFAVVASVTGILASATFLGNDPAMRDAPFRQRIVFALSRRPRGIDENAE